ncbi:MAG: acyl-CoA dehydrogenase [Alphaproteobacteria bacterium]|nr:acyl-CoA dehydrogenase [Alphaproteobacteria bacterium]
MTLPVSRRDLDFLLFEWLGVGALTQRPAFADHGPETFAAALDTAWAIAEREFLPHNRKADLEEPRLENGRVIVVPEAKAALDAFAAAGFLAMETPLDAGGMALPHVVAQACFGLFDAANIATASYPLLTIAAANLIDTFGSSDQKRRWLPAMRSGRVFGTMVLTEPHAGSSLGDVRTTATPAGDGRYRVRGAKIFISGGDHELADNIVHLVLCRIAGAPPGVKGLSLMLVPKRLVGDDGSPGAANDVALAGLIHKMGWRGTTSTMLSFGENDTCFGELIGEPGRGLAQMFHMMNEARIGVGLGAAMLGHAGYRHALAYAKARPQGRPVDAKDPAAPQVAIVEHADVRRMLLAQKAYAEGGLALCLYAARLVDEARTAPDGAARAAARRLLDILTPIVKAWPAEWCLEANKLAIQVHGGYGYTREYPVEQLYRDNRLNPIHEGTNGIQAIDLLGRKVMMEDGALLAELVGRIRATIDAAASVASLSEFAGALDASLADVGRATAAARGALAAGEVRLALANAAPYLDLLGHVVVAWLWLDQAITAFRSASAADAVFHAGKRAACAWFFRWELPKVAHWANLVATLDPTTVELDPGSL